MYDRSNRIMHCKAQIRMLKGEWCHSMLHTLYYILVIKAQVDSVARGPYYLNCVDMQYLSYINLGNTS